MIKSPDFESEDGYIRVRPNMELKLNEQTQTNVRTNDLAYVTIFSASNKVHISAQYIEELIDMLTEIKLTYIDKVEFLN